MKGKFVYVATPYAALGLDKNSTSIVATRLAKDTCRIIKDAGYTPISPVLCFDGIYDEAKDREKVMKNCLDLMELCNYVYFSQHPASRNSAEMKIEKEQASKIGLTELSFDVNLQLTPSLGL
ncbi:DUF1937 family protein [Campylobacter pinnipediorum]|uniref:DUF1937 family protein n=1 Tax=Campylobacter pinnipediorum TaxID=1965231 RepID=UPI00084CF6A4|nr:DUF1937 family protein [Campylobacter pinnipediorum]AQW80773.1 hypothetical protein CPIN17260_0445 [Campylobacter pinnipediorum subsp. pinnipediorum]AQW83341.1 hypothetical protein CPIN17261_1343 [Campylobacter pinnipediorum subsp. pinnipediorum]OPA75416.1 hypothetical protein BFG05_05960 [Campylobacter pinnipediorum subsp. pinnipediorum]